MGKSCKGVYAFLNLSAFLLISKQGWWPQGTMPPLLHFKICLNIFKQHNQQPIRPIFKENYLMKKM